MLARMLYVYLFGAVVGGSLLVASLVGAGHGHLSQLFGLGHHGGGGGGGHHSTGSNAALQVFSIQLWTYFFGFGGLTGLLLREFAQTPEPLCAGLSAGIGLTAGVAARLVLTRAARIRPGDSGTLGDRDLIGAAGEVVVPFGDKQTGKVRVVIQNHTLDLLATSEDGAQYALKDPVLVLDVRAGQAVVSRHR